MSANIELNIVGLGDFSDINSKLAALREQVTLLQKGLAGTSLTSDLSSQLNNLNNVFKTTMTSSGQFTEQTVKLKTETENFGQALVTGKLRLSEYFSIIKGEASAATNQLKALAVEQTKLQNSVVMQQPGKSGVFSVYTPTQIDQVANATKIATSYQNLYNIAVDKGSQALINWGKNTQWAGRQLTVGMSVPLTIFGTQAVNAFKSVNTELTRLQRLYGEGLTPPSQEQLQQISSQVLQLGQQIASTMGIAQTETVKTAANFAAMGKQGQDLLNITMQTERLSKLGGIDSTQATNAIVALQNVYKTSTTDLADAVNFLSDMQKQTTMSLSDMTDAIPRVGPIMQQLGGNYKDTAVMLLAMKEAGVPAAQAANALKSAFASIIAPTAGATKEFASFGINLAQIKNAGTPVQMITELQQSLLKLSPLVREQLIEKLFGKFQFARISALINNFGQVGSQTVNALKVAGATSSQLADLANQEMKQATSSPTAQWQRALETFKADLYPVGQEIIKIGTMLLNFGNKISQIFQGLPGPLKLLFGILAGGVALSGPIIMLTGLLANFAGYLMKGAFAIKNLATGATTLREFLTPQLIASKNAAMLFQDKMLGDADAATVLNKAIQDLTASLAGMSAAMVSGAPGGIPSVPGSVLDQNTPYGPMSRSAVRKQLGLFSAPKAIDAQTRRASWSSRESETSAAEAAIQAELAAGNITAKQAEDARKSFSTTVASHVNEDLSGKMFGNIPMTWKNWRAGNLRPDLQGVNQLQSNMTTETKYKEQIAALSADNNALKDMSAKIEASANGVKITTDELKAELDLIAKGTSTMSEKQMLILRELIQGDQNIYAIASRAVLNQRLANGQYGKETANFYNPAQDVLAAEQVQAQVDKTPAYLSPTGFSAGRTKPITDRELQQKAAEDAKAQAVIDQALANQVTKDTPIIENATDNVMKDAAKSGTAAGVAAVKEAAPQMGAAVAKDMAVMEEEIAAPELWTAGGRKVVNTILNGVNSTKAEQEAAGAAIGETIALSAEAGAAGGISGALQGGEGQIVEQAASKGIKGLFGRVFGSMKSGGPLGTGILAMGAMTAADALLPNTGAGGTAKGAINAASTGAMIGSIIPGVGTIAGAAIGGLGDLAFKGISDMIKQSQINAAEAASQYKVSTSALSIFGGTAYDTTIKMTGFTQSISGLTGALGTIPTPLQNLINQLKQLPSTDPFSQLVASLKKTTNVDDITSQIGNQVSAAITSGALDPSKAQQYVQALLSMSGHTSDFLQVWKKLQTQVGTATGAIVSDLNTLGLNAVIEQATNQTSNFAFAIISTKTDIASLKDAYNNIGPANKAYADELYNIFGILGSGQLTTKQYTTYIDGLSKASLDGAATMAYLNMEIAANGTADEQKRWAMVQASVAAVGGAAKVSGVELMELETILQSTSTVPKGFKDMQSYITYLLKNPKALATAASSANDAMNQIIAQMNKALGGPAAGGGAGTGGTGFTATKAQTDAKKRLEGLLKDQNAILKAAKDQLTQEQKISQEQQKQMQYQQDMYNLRNQAKQAMISGDYLAAAGFRQQASATQVTFNQSEAQTKLQNNIDVLQNSADLFNQALSDLTDAISSQSTKLDSNINAISKSKVTQQTPISGSLGNVVVNNNIQVTTTTAGATAAEVAAGVHKGTMSALTAAKLNKNNKVTVGGGSSAP